MKFLSFLVILVFLLTTSLPAKVLFIPKDNLPLEFALLIESIGQYQLTYEERKTFSNYIRKCDSAFNMMSKKEIEFITKSEIYKTLLRPLTSKLPSRKMLSQSLPNIFKDEIVNNYKEYNSLAIWIIRSVSADLKSIEKSTDLDAFAKILSSDEPITKKNQKKIYKRLSNSYIWYNLIKGKAPEEFNQFLFEELLPLLGRITKYSIHLIRFSRFKHNKITSQEELNFFSIPKNPKVEKKSSKSQSKALPATALDRLLNPIIEKESQKNEAQKEQKNDKWRPKDTAILPPHYPTPNPNYIPPDVLPTPVDEWPENGEKVAEIAPTPNPDPDENWILE